ncbi:MAG: DUF2085 domain-containing protein [Anaerolineales bacterium]|nr:DUF2085 domain-containing protein [Anaerolineales bacterium]MCB9128312.1 DUF2085 domain-containing protein [Ardenticatenales bacterium]MCB9172125.1 DUF2085 domain-containing protein [Ardenticatenales bacterium]
MSAVLPEAQQRPTRPEASSLNSRLERGMAFVSRHWLGFANGFWALFLFGAFLAPLFMALGWGGPAAVLYKIYSFTCHQLPERSFFLFGPQHSFTMYELGPLLAAGADGSDLLRLREFVGTPELGWKLGFSDRMVAMYGGALAAGLVYGWLRRRGSVKPFPLWLLLLLVIPMALDGTTHLISDLGFGWRETNAWAYRLFGNQPADFYSGTTFGTLNSTLRLLTGTLFGFGMMFFAYPYMDYGFEDLAQEVEHNRQLRVAHQPPGELHG